MIWIYKTGEQGRKKKKSEGMEWNREVSFFSIGVGELNCAVVGEEGGRQPRWEGGPEEGWGGRLLLENSPF
jgi:hypothetical protein